MALATRCPNCHALFRVVADQLKLRGGLVRCGACQHVFDAIGTLSYIDDAVLSTVGPTTGAVPASATPSTVAAAFAPQPTLGEPTERPSPDASQSSAPETEYEVPVAQPPAIETTELPSEETPAASLAAIDSPADASTGEIDSAEVEEGRADSAVAIDEEVATTGDEEPNAPEFLRDESSPRRRGVSVILWTGTVALVLLALAQLAIMFRADILARFPQSRPVLTELCKAFRCTVDWPARGEMLAVVGSELQALPGTSAFELTAIVRNRSAFTLALPAIELTLTDTLNRTVARKVFAPVDYLAGESDPQARLLAGLEAGADLTIKIAFEARGLNAAGFVVYPFYL